MEYNKDLKKISGDSVVVNENSLPYPTIIKSIGGATYIARMHFTKDKKKTLSDKLIRLMEEEEKHGDR